MPTKYANHSYAHLFSSVDAVVPLLDGSKRMYVNLDNAASTPALNSVQDAVNNFLTYYSSVHRGTGFKSQISTHAYGVAREIVIEFVGADPETHV
jgi:selenocysteine lyase/cysteine desulfurase